MILSLVYLSKFNEDMFLNLDLIKYIDFGVIDRMQMMNFVALPGLLFSLLPNVV